MTISPTLTDAHLDRLRRLGASFCLAEGGSHGPDHSERVLQTALNLGRREESRSRGGVCHAERGAELAAPLLRELGYTEADVAAICHCIRAHRYRDASEPATLEADILFDADKLDSIGAVGIGRAFLFAGQIGARLHNPDIDPARTRPYSLEDTAYREFRVKMSRVRDHMRTAVGRQMAQQRHAFMETFFAQLTRETGGQGR